MTDYNENLHNNANPSTYKNAPYFNKQKRRQKQSLRNRKLMNLKFRRQHPFGNYVLDFYCHQIKLCIEADGGIHKEKDVKQYDIKRTRILNENGITVLRFANQEITETTIIVT